jgi:Ni,Fe-hydrogenase III large subunit
MSVENILMWMINGGIGQTYTGRPMVDWLAERINGLMQYAHEIIRARAIKDAFWE